jgi:DNA-binding beta-propeller fold protein YncE
MKGFRASGRHWFLVPVVTVALAVGAAGTAMGVCGPFADVSDPAFCSIVLQLFYLGITTGTSPTTFDPGSPVSRLQMSAFLSRSVDAVLKRGSRRAALNQFWTPQNETVIDVTTLGTSVAFPATDGLDLWVPSGNTVCRVRASDGALLQTWTGASTTSQTLSAIGKIFVVGRLSPGTLYRIDPRQPAGAVTTVASNLGDGPFTLTFDGSRIWTANQVGSTGSVSIVTPGATIPWTVTTITAGFTTPTGLLFDGSNVWMTDVLAGTLLKLSSAGAVLQTVTVGAFPALPVFDGTNIWVPNFNSNSITVVRASSGAVLQTLTGNGLSAPNAAAFDGQRVAVVNALTTPSVSLWKADDLAPLGSIPTGPGSQPLGICSDGINFWIAFRTNQIGRL